MHEKVWGGETWERLAESNIVQGILLLCGRKIDFYRDDMSFFIASRVLSSSTHGKRCYLQRPSGQPVVIGVFPLPPRYVPSFLARIEFSIPTFQLFMPVDLHPISPTRALALPACQYLAKRPLRDSNLRHLPRSNCAVYY